MSHSELGNGPPVQLCLRADVPGVVSITSYARTHMALVEYDPTVTNPGEIREAAVEPIVHEGETYQVFQVVSERGAD